jgi:hypothetical protein
MRCFFVRVTTVGVRGRYIENGHCPETAEERACNPASEYAVGIMRQAPRSWGRRLGAVRVESDAARAGKVPKLGLWEALNAGA